MFSITSAKYRLNPLTRENDTIVATIDGQQWDVPIMAGNSHYDRIMTMVSEGQLTIAAADPLPDAE